MMDMQQLLEDLQLRFLVYQNALLQMVVRAGGHVVLPPAENDMDMEADYNLMTRPTPEGGVEIRVVKNEAQGAA